MKQEALTIREVFSTIRQSFSFLLRRWLIILLMAILGAGVGLTYSFLKKPIYTAECTFVLEEESRGALSQYSGIASMVGIDLGGSGGGLFQGDNIIQLYKSKSMIRKTLLSKASLANGTNLVIDRYIYFNKLNAQWGKKARTKDVNFHGRLSFVHDSLLNIIIKDIGENYLVVTRPDKKLSIISVQVKGRDEIFAKMFVEVIVENVNNFYVATKVKKTSGSVKILERQADSVRRILNASIGKTALAIDANPNANDAMQTLRVPSQRKQIDVQANTAIYSEIVKNLEISRISLRKETPLIQIIDKPVLPLEKEKVGKLKGIIVGGVICTFITVLFLLMKKILTDII